MTLTQDQRKAVEAGQNVPLNVDGIDCILVRADVFEKVRNVLSDDLTHEELDAMLAVSAEGSDWMDPAMDIYDEYDKHRQ
jgi:hypothetical protein